MALTPEQIARQQALDNAKNSSWWGSSSTSSTSQPSQPEVTTHGGGAQTRVDPDTGRNQIKLPNSDKWLFGGALEKTESTSGRVSQEMMDIRNATRPDEHGGAISSPIGDAYLRMTDEQKREFQLADAAGQEAIARRLAQESGVNLGGGNVGSGMGGQSQQNDLLQQILDNMRGMSDSYYESQKGILDASRSAAIADLKKAYDDAVASGEMSVREAEDAFAQQVEMINQDAYRNAENRNVVGQQRGIGNSQQFLGMQATDQARTSQLSNQNRSIRDTRIADIKTRINSLTTQRDLDINRVNEQYNANLSSARASADLAYQQQAGNLMMGDYQAQQQFQQQLALMSQQNQYNRENMGLGHQYDLDKMGLGQQFDLDKMDKQNDYNVAMQDQNFQNDLQKMATQNGYNVANMIQEYALRGEQMDKGHKQDLEKMAKAHGYDMSKIAQQYNNQVSLFNKQVAQAEKEAEKAIQLEQQRYERDMERALSQYTPGTSEYKIAQSQLEAQNRQRQQEIMEEFRTNAYMNSIFNNPYLSQGLTGNLKEPTPNGFGNFNPKEVDNYNSVLDAIRRYNSVYNEPGWEGMQIPVGGNFVPPTDARGSVDIYNDKTGNPLSNWLLNLLK